MTAFHRSRHLTTIGDDLCRQRDTIEKLNSPNDPRLFQAIVLIAEAAALVKEAAGTVPGASSPARRDLF